MSFLSAIGKDVKGVFSWLGSSKGQQLIQTGEAIAVSVYPPITGILTIANTWLTEIIKAETLAAAAGSQTGSGTQKAAMTISAVEPQLIAFLKSQNIAIPAQAQIEAASTALVTFLNVFGAPASPAVTTSNGVIGIPNA